VPPPAYGPLHQEMPRPTAASGVSHDDQ
jgi:hypothetical protein